MILHLKLHPRRSILTLLTETPGSEYNIAFGGKIEQTKGYFINPTIIDNPPDESRIVVEEPFGNSKHGE
jgi:acyl-CoA reductase-like NAD-dependent aldehyde dehydrogenase